jgi:hypothetical protein
MISMDNEDSGYVALENITFRLEDTTLLVGLGTIFDVFHDMATQQYVQVVEVLRDFPANNNILQLEDAAPFHNWEALHIQELHGFPLVCCHKAKDLDNSAQYVPLLDMAVDRSTMEDTASGNKGGLE